MLRAHSQTQRTHSVPQSPQKGLVFPFLLEGRVHTERQTCHWVPPASVPRLLVFIDWTFISWFPRNGSSLFKHSHLAFLWLLLQSSKSRDVGPATSCSVQWVARQLHVPGHSLSWSSVMCLSTTGPPPLRSSSLCFRWLFLFSFLGLWYANYFESSRAAKDASQQNPEFQHCPFQNHQCS